MQIIEHKPFDTHGCESENGADCRNVLNVMDKLAAKFPKGPRIRKQLSKLKGRESVIFTAKNFQRVFMLYYMYIMLCIFNV